MRAPNHLWRVIAAFALVAGAAVMPAIVHAQATSNIGDVQLNAQRYNEFLSLSATPGQINFTLHANGASDGDVPLVAQVDYVLDPQGGSRDLRLVFFFTSSDALVATGGAIPATNVLAKLANVENDYSPFILDPPSGVYSYPLALAVTGSGTFVQPLALRIDTTGLTLVSVPYSGTIYVQATVL